LIKDQIYKLLENSEFERVVVMVAVKKRLLGTLLSLTFDREPLIAWRAVEAMGHAADHIAADNPDYVLSHLRRLHWLLSEEAGGICLFAPPAMAEIIRLRPEMFAGFIPLVVSLIITMEEEDLEYFRPKVLWAIGRLAPVAGEEVESVIPAVVAALEDHQPQVRGTAVWCLGQAGKRKLLSERTDLLSDNGQLELYMDGKIIHTKISDLVSGILSSKA
jgi:hypothetical protein